MGSYLYDYGDSKSPLAEIIKAPEFIKPATDAIYFPARYLSEVFGRPED